MIASRVACGTLWVLPDVGHSPHTEAHERYNERILQFLLS
jgi:pimeloyl-ACP methyl ester carboxylesterase